jgi:hypothetical protein
MILDDYLKELEISLTHWGRESKNYSLQINLEKTVMLRLLRNRKTITKIRGSEIKQINRFTHFRSVVEENSKIQNDVNERARKASKFYHLIKSKE